MNLATLSLFVRSIRTETRDLRTYILRTLILVFVVVFLFSVMGNESLTAVGLKFYHDLLLALTYIFTLYGIVFFAADIAEEKEVQSLGLMRMTQLGPLSILLGKSAGRLLNIFFTILMITPFMFLAVTLGGVTTTQVLAGLMAVLAHLFMLANIALFCSVSCKDSRQAASVTFLIMVFAYLPAMIASSELPRNHELKPLADFIANTFVQTRIDAVLRSGYSDSIVAFQFYSNLLVGAAMFGLSWLSFNFFTRDNHVSQVSGALIYKWKMYLKHVKPTRSHDRHSVFWKDFHVLHGGYPQIAIKLMVGGILIFVLVYAMCLERYYTQAHYDFSSFWAQNRDNVSATITVACLLIFIGELGFRFTKAFGEERQNGTLPSIMHFPYPNTYVFVQKMLAALFSMIPVALFFILGIFFDPAQFFDSFFYLTDKPMIWAIMSTVFMFYYLCVFLSLKINKGAMAMALIASASLFMLTGFSLSGMFNASEDTIAKFIIFETLVTCIVLHFHFIRRELESAAAD